MGIKRLAVALTLLCAVSPRDLRAQSSPPPAIAQPAPVEVTLRDVRFRIPRRYLDIAFSGQGFSLEMLADTLQPIPDNPPPPGYPRNWLRFNLHVSVGWDARVSAEHSVQFGRSHWWSQPYNLPLEETPSTVLDEPGGAPVPAGLRYFRALPNSDPASSGVRHDRFLIEDAAGLPDVSPEAGEIRCVSKISSPLATRLGLLRCEWNFAYRGFLVGLSFDRRYLDGYRSLRRGALDLVESFIVSDAAAP